MLFAREKKTDCGRYREVDIIPRTETGERAAKGKRGRRRKVSAPKQAELNDKNARRYLVQLGNGNFGEGDIHLSVTYSEEFLPGSVEEAEKEVRNYLSRVSYHMRKAGTELRYILVTEYGYSRDGTRLTRVHHHIILNGGLPRDKIESLWSKGRKPIGWANADRLKPDKNGIEALCRYLLKNPQGKKRWSSSRNLKRPYESRNDSKYSYRKVIRFAGMPDSGREYFGKIYRGYEITEISPEYYENTGWHIYLKMWKRPPDKGKKRRKD